MLFFPSKETVGIPGFSFEIPEGWSVTHPDHVLFCVIHPQEVFSPNTVVALDRRSGDIAGDVIMGEYVGVCCFVEEFPCDWPAVWC